MGDAVNPNLAPLITHQPSLLGGAENIKLLFDEELDSRREVQARQRAWEAISLDMAQIASRRAQQAASFDKAMDTVMVLAAQVGITEGQQTVSPAGTSASEAIKGAVGTAAAGEAVSAEGITANVVNLFTATIPTIASSLATSISQTIIATLPALIKAAGVASNPPAAAAPSGS